MRPGGATHGSAPGGATPWTAPRRRRALLGACVRGGAAAWLLSLAAPEAEGMAAALRGTGRGDVARDVERAVLELRAVAEAWRDAERDDPSGPGSAELPAGGGVPGSAAGVVDTPAAAAALDVSERRVRQLLAAGTLKGARVGGRWVVDRADLERVRARRELMRG